MKLNPIKMSLVIASAFVVLGGGASALATSTPSTGSQQTLSAYMACMKTAVIAREVATVASWNNYTATTTTARGVHQTASVAAWGLADARSAERAETLADQTLRKSLGQAEKVLRESMSMTNKTFRQAREACRLIKRQS